MNSIERRLKAMVRMAADDDLSWERLLDLFLDTRSDEELDALEHYARAYACGEGRRAEEDLPGYIEIELSRFNSMSFEDIRRLAEIDSKTQGFTDSLAPEEAAWVRSFGFKRDLWVTGEEADDTLADFEMMG